MIILIHNGKQALEIFDSDMKSLDEYIKAISIVDNLIFLSQKYSDSLLVWCHYELKEFINLEGICSIFKHKKILASYQPNQNYYLPKQIGYIDRTWFINVNKKVQYPTWQMSSHIGGVYAEVISNISSSLKKNSNFDYFLNSLAKQGMNQGLFCYSNPNFIKENCDLNINKTEASIYTLFKFVKEHYKWFWVYFLTFSYLIFEKKLILLPLLKTLFYKKQTSDFNLNKINIQFNEEVIEEKTIDVIIPTIGRKPYLYDVLKDLSTQTILPKNVIIVEQNPVANSISELDYLTNEDWPFNIKHTFTNQPGVCNARNIALSQLESEWAFFADDDIRFDSNFFESTFNTIQTYAIDAISYLCLQPQQKQTYFKTEQTIVFGSGSSFVKSSVLKGLEFDMAYEFGFGEDSDFGMQIRNKGTDIIFIPHIKITHLKAPFGGYRIKIKQLWDHDNVQPKPSPTVQLLYQTYYTQTQIKGYKLLLFIRLLNSSGYKKPIRFKSQFKKQWNQSVYWSKKLKGKMKVIEKNI